MPQGVGTSGHRGQKRRFIFSSKFDIGSFLVEHFTIFQLCFIIFFLMCMFSAVEEASGGKRGHLRRRPSISLWFYFLGIM